MSEEKSHDPIIERVVDKIRGRSKVGLEKYGVSLMDDPGNLDTWLNHLQEELMDAVNYIERAREELNRDVLTSGSNQVRINYVDPLPAAFRTCNCTMGCPTGKCWQDG